MIKISIVTVTFNCENVIEQTIKSIIDQTYPFIEFIIIDGGSIDGTINIINRYKEQISNLISEPDKGIFDAMNKSLNYVSGDYTIFINAGDRFINKNIICNIFENKEYKADIIYGDIYIENKWGYSLRKADPIYTKKPSKRDLVFKSQGICHQAIFTRTTILKKIKFNIKYSLGADYDTTYKIFYNGNSQLEYVGFPISIFDDRYGGKSHNQTIRVLKERCSMFKYSIKINFYFIAYSKLLKSKIKLMIEKYMPYFVKRIKEKKYMQKI